MARLLFAYRLLFAQPGLGGRERVGAQVAVAAFAVLVLYPAVGSGYHLAQLRDALLLAIFALSLDYLWGRTRMLVMGHALFFGIGAYGMAIATTRLGWPTGGGLLLGIAVAASVAAAVGYFLLYAGVRLHFFAVLTMAMSLIATQIAVSWSSVTGGDVGILGVPPIEFSAFGLHYSGGDGTASYYGALFLAFLTMLVLWLACRGPYGLILEAIGSNENRARTLGFDTARQLLIAFTASAALAAFAGALFATTAGVVAPDLLGTLLSTEVMIWVAIGGRGTFVGPLLATLLVHQASQTISSLSTSLWPLLLGVLFLLIVFAAPDGPVSLLRRRKEA
ncbi:branched-chain amino acid ABC transporter permease [Bradyrhizobium sp. Arg237L]|uniref:branched-chain amino acid ABC transporter permease n=1 Tax=Bradyrhizobium sp. Arg237L TaxID=3003352 RepID=UPI00249F353B|nr:branched-chain amino acid ABC transporter permease [Bradyrhizobium sp. Arg237L]MDI4235425.1 branched-chain amino acid ABC transporter permease [Bradyrhizobium sp. Arg237L]